MPSPSRSDQIRALLAETPDDALLRYMLGMEQASGGDDAAAVATFRDIIVRAEYVPAYHMAGQALARLGKIEEACDVLRAGVVVAGRTGETHAQGEMQGLLESLE